MAKSRVALCNVFILVITLIRRVEPYSVGAPSSACAAMTPQHGPAPQTSAAPYRIVHNVTSIEGGKRFMVKLQSSSPAFKGFFIQARSVDTNEPVGAFFAGNHKLVSCSNGVNNGVTHSSSSNLNDVAVEWEAPSNLEGRVQFRATVVKDYSTFWTGLLSDEVSIQKRSLSSASDVGSQGTSPPPAPVSSNEVASQAPQSMSIESDLSNLYYGCGVSKTCSGSPGGCEEKKNCKFVVTYTDAGNGMYEFELKGKGGNNRYVAAGLSFDNRMGDDSVMVCGSGSESVDVFMKWNNGRSNENILKPKEGLRPIVSGEMDGVLYCKFQRREITRPKNKQTFDLKREKFHIMVAEGSMAGDNLNYHGDNKIVSSRPASLGQTSKLEQRDTRLFKMIHGCLMVSAWVCAASCGILFARYFKQTWLSYKCCNIDQWFHFHRLFMVIVWGCSIAAVVLIIYELQEFRVSYHSVIGIISFGFCFIQPFMAALRPHPNSKNRGVFNWMHWFVGNTAQILGITAIFFGYELFLGSERNWLKELAWYILVAFIVFHCVMHLMLSISQCCTDRRPKSSDVFPLKDFSGSRSLLQPEKMTMDAPYGCFRKFILGLYLPVNWIVSTVLILMIVFTREEIETQFTDWEIPKFWENL